MLDFEKQYYSEKVKLIVGIDEAGRGPLCGPVVAACCILPPDYQNDLINDSKKLTEKKREVLFEKIKNDAIAYGIGIIGPEIIDKINIYEATKVAMLTALSNMKHDFDLVVTDAMPLSVSGKEVIPIIKGDAKCLNIAAASILAKVTRDHILEEYDSKFPEFNFKKHKGYCTKLHQEIINSIGILPGFYRFSYAPVRNAFEKAGFYKK